MKIYRIDYFDSMGSNIGATDTYGYYATRELADQVVAILKTKGWTTLSIHEITVHETPELTQ